MRHVYQAFLDIYIEMEQVLSKEGKLDRVYYAKYEMKKLVRAYFKEAQWLNDDNHIPKYEEHMEISLVSAAYMMGSTTSLVGMEEFISKDTFEWLMNEPLIVRAASLISRAMDDIVGHEEGQLLARSVLCSLPGIREEILEEALTFTTTHLESMLSNLSNDSLRLQITETLSNDAHDNLLLKFAKLDFNMLQKMHQRELRMYFELKYNRVRTMMTKVLKMSSIIDDTYDAYGTIDELAPFTVAIQRWDISAINSIVPYLRPAYEGLLDVYSEMEQVLAKECKSDCLYYAKHEMKKLVSAYFKEAQWLDAGYIPKCEEHLENALAEQERGHVASIIERYMKEYGASKQEAYMKYHKEVINGWKDVLERVLNFARVMDMLYKEEDAYTNSKGKLKNMISLLLVESIKI
ncbi:hypothetical protein MTR67_027744 [Solanum verrucosum]|uniref:Terpene synthase metal-binding domain-containing protein n=1 Tax=Solanum verrucosum TaxID=315347 RepID=A0AAF0TVZ4_SOLVR|nr:hypothetical protein MTR67_027744 [Solanum verrucosum]